MPDKTGTSDTETASSALQPEQIEKCTDKVSTLLGYLFDRGGLKDKELVGNKDGGLLVEDILAKCRIVLDKKKKSFLTVDMFCEIVAQANEKKETERMPFTLIRYGDSMGVKPAFRAPTAGKTITTPPETPMAAEEKVEVSLESKGHSNKSQKTKKNSEKDREENISKKRKEDEDLPPVEGDITSGKSSHNKPESPIAAEEEDECWLESKSQSNKSKKKKKKNKQDREDNISNKHKEDEDLPPVKGDITSGKSSHHMLEGKDLPPPKESVKGDAEETTLTTNRKDFSPDPEKEYDPPIQQDRKSESQNIDVSKQQIKKLWKTLHFVFDKGAKENAIPMDNGEVLVIDIIKNLAGKNNNPTMEAFEAAFQQNEAKVEKNREPYIRSGKGESMRIRLSPEAARSTEVKVEPNPTTQGASRTDWKDSVKKEISFQKNKAGHSPSRKHARSGDFKHNSTYEENFEEKRSRSNERQHSDRRGRNNSPRQREDQHYHQRKQTDPTHGGENRKWDRQQQHHAQQHQGQPYYQQYQEQQYHWGHDGRNYQANTGQQHGDYNFGSRRREDHDVKLSKTLSTVLRHRGKDLNFNILPGGFIYIDELLRHKFFRGYTQDDVLRVVQNNDKKRFYVDLSERPKIRANQGHTMEVDVEMREITDPTEFPNVIHGTYYENWEAIKKTGLARMGRNHIHFAPGEPGESGVISGMRASCPILIAVDIGLAIKDGIKFYVSANNVILTEGNEHGVLPKKYFRMACDRFERHMLPLE